MFSDLTVYEYFPHHLGEGLLNFRRRECPSFWPDFAFQDPPRKRTTAFFFITHKDFCIAKRNFLIEFQIPCSGYKLISGADFRYTNFPLRIFRTKDHGPRTMDQGPKTKDPGPQKRRSSRCPPTSPGMANRFLGMKISSQTHPDRP